MAITVGELAGGSIICFSGVYESVPVVCIPDALKILFNTFRITVDRPWDTKLSVS